MNKKNKLPASLLEDNIEQLKEKSSKSINKDLDILDKKHKKLGETSQGKMQENIKNSFVYALSIFLIIGFGGCDNSQIYNDYNTFDSLIWHKNDQQIFSFEVKDTTKAYNIFTTFRIAIQYPFYNLFYKYTLQDSKDSVLSSKQKQLVLFDEKTGAPLGDGLGDMFDYEDIILKKIKFSSKETYKIIVEQYMRREKLPGVVSIGSRVSYVSVEEP